MFEAVPEERAVWVTLTYHGGLCYGAEAVDEDVTGDVDRRSCRTTRRHDRQKSIHEKTELLKLSRVKKGYRFKKKP